LMPYRIPRFAQDDAQCFVVILNEVKNPDAETNVNKSGRHIRNNRGQMR